MHQRYPVGLRAAAPAIPLRPPACGPAAPHPDSHRPGPASPCQVLDGDAVAAGGHGHEQERPRARCDSWPARSTSAALGANTFLTKRHRPESQHRPSLRPALVRAIDWGARPPGPPPAGEAAGVDGREAELLDETSTVSLAVMLAAATDPANWSPLAPP